MIYKKYTIEQVILNKIAITFPIKKDYEKFIHYVNNTNIRHESFCLIDWDEWKKNTCAVYREMFNHGFQVNSKKLMKYLSHFKKSIKFKQLILLKEKPYNY